MEYLELLNKIILKNILRRHFIFDDGAKVLSQEGEDLYDIFIQFGIPQAIKAYEKYKHSEKMLEIVFKNLIKIYSNRSVHYYREKRKDSNCGIKGVAPGEILNRVIEDKEITVDFRNPQNILMRKEFWNSIKESILEFGDAGKWLYLVLYENKSKKAAYEQVFGKKYGTQQQINLCNKIQKEFRKKGVLI